jgi:hypothetical protein
MEQSAFDEQLAEIAAIERPRETLTARAMGLTWMVWGLGLTLAGFAGLAGRDAERLAGDWFLAVEAAFALTAIIAAGVATRGVWIAHGLHRDPASRAWWIWLAAPGFVILWAIINFVHGTYLYRSDGLLFGRYALVAAFVALFFMLLSRRHVRANASIVVAGVLVAVYAVAQTITVASEVGQTIGNMLVVTMVLASYMIAGYVTLRRG